MNSYVRSELEVGQKKGISGSTIKMIAIISMLIDHIGAAVVGRLIQERGFAASDMQLMMNGQLPDAEMKLFMLYWVMRMIGRLGFPIFCFLLIEGFEHTRNVTKYALRLFTFALISEIPFDLAFSGKFFYKEYQNVFFTLLIGLLVMMVFRQIENSEKFNAFLKVLFRIAVLVLGMVLAEFMKTDYSWIGVLCIACLYLTRKNKAQQIITGCIAFSWELTAPLAFIPIGFYNGKRGWNIKYFFYIFYPAHLLILYLIVYAMGMGGLPSM